MQGQFTPLIPVVESPLSGQLLTSIKCDVLRLFNDQIIIIPSRTPSPSMHTGPRAYESGENKTRGVYRTLKASRSQLCPSLQPPATLMIYYERGDGTDREIKLSVVSEIPGEYCNERNTEFEIFIKQATGTYSTLSGLLSPLKNSDVIRFFDCNHPKIEPERQSFVRLYPGAANWFQKNIKAMIWKSENESDSPQRLSFSWEVRNPNTQVVRPSIL